MAKEWIDPRDVKPQTAGTLFLIGPIDGLDTVNMDLGKAPAYQVVFVRVRVVMGQINIEDVGKVASVARLLLTSKVPFVSFAAGRDLPYPEYQGDLDDFMGGIEQGVKSLRRDH